MSKTRVNLYSVALLPVRQRLSFARMSAVAGALLLLGLALMGLEHWQSQQLDDQLQAAIAQNQALEQQLGSLQQALQQHQPDAALQQKLSQLTQEQQLKTLLLTELGKRDQFKSSGFSQMLQDLATVADGNVWLSHVRLEPQQLLFEGYAQQAAHVPHWVERLSHTDSFRGKAFASMMMNRGTQQPLAFTLTTETAKDVKP
ncbi:PilN domain-containing protein [Shewanella sp. YIC-542]|uniref:PilN domain-containing protein n=1 Tax=Shewanella mytili TaxID=3377111 RepID=UPI00398EF1B1